MQSIVSVAEDPIHFNIELFSYWVIFHKLTKWNTLKSALVTNEILSRAPYIPSWAREIFWDWFHCHWHFGIFRLIPNVSPCTYQKSFSFHENVLNDLILLFLCKVEIYGWSSEHGKFSCTFLCCINLFTLKLFSFMDNPSFFNCKAILSIQEHFLFCISTYMSLQKCNGNPLGVAFHCSYMSLTLF